MASSLETFEHIGLSPWLVDACVELGLKRPTPIQAACIRPALAGQDVLGSAETGSGKTAAFVLPMLQALSCDPFGVFSVILSPARELASQIADQVTALGSGMGVRVVTIVGGHDMMKQALVLAQRPHVVVATPGRLADHLRSGDTAAALRRLRMLIIDEADRLLELGFHDDLTEVLSHLPAKRQTLLFSATMSGALHQLQKLALKAPFVADLAAKEAVVDKLEQRYVFIPANVRDVYLAYLLRQLEQQGSTVIVFTATCRACELLACMLRALSLPCEALHSQQPQARRLSAIGRFKQGSLKVLIATDVASRGLDIPRVGCVLNHNIPAAPRDYIHRCGRTARAGRGGRALSLVSQYDVELLLAIEEHMGTKVEAFEPDEGEVLKMLAEVASARRVAMLELTDNGFLEKEKARRIQKRQQRMADAGGDVDEVRSAADAAEPLAPSTPADTAVATALVPGDVAKDPTTGGVVGAGGTGGRKKLQTRKRERVAQESTAVEMRRRKSSRTPPIASLKPKVARQGPGWPQPNGGSVVRNT